MEFLHYLLFFYSFLGILIAGGLLFNKENKANIFLAIFILVFSIGQLNFLYHSTSLRQHYLEFNGAFYAIWMLFGPSLWLYISYFNQQNTINWKKVSIHLIPFGVYVLFTFYFFSYSPQERIVFFRKNFMNIMMPFNYGIAIHLSVYAILMIIFVRKHIFSPEKKVYTNVVVGIYLLTAILQFYLTSFARSYQWFVYYFLAMSTVIFFIGYMLYYKPAILKEIITKYYTSGLDKNGKNRIAKKIQLFLQNNKKSIDASLDLTIFCKEIDEKKQYVSQTISEEFNVTFTDLINKQRVEYAKLLLSNPANKHLKIFAIALDAGFTNKTTFHRVFVKFTKITPNEFRKKSVI